ncbi:MAG TPA: hypothetical protein VN154_06815 [Rhizomicrobium sp.]|nr:hypothetical protein [Rhizomicrobium sp.]
MLTQVESIKGEDDEDMRLLMEMAEQARDYVTSFQWCPPIAREWLADGIGGVVAIFLFEFTHKIDGDDKVWVIVGDLPPAFKAVEPNDTPQSVLDDYCFLMDDWIAAVRTGGSFDDVFPVAAARTEEHARMLESRLATLRDDIIPQFSTDRATDAKGKIVVPGK